MSNVLQNNEYVCPSLTFRNRMIYSTWKILKKFLSSELTYSTYFAPQYSPHTLLPNNLKNFPASWGIDKARSVQRQNNELPWGPVTLILTHPLISSAYFLCLASFLILSISTHLIYYLTIYLIISFPQMCLRSFYLDFMSRVLTAKAFAQEASSSSSTFIHLYLAKNNLLYCHLRLMDVN